MDVVGFSVGRGDYSVDCADEHAVIFDVRLLWQPVADVDQVRDHPNVLVKSAGGFDHHRDGEQGRDHHHRRADGKQLPVRGPAAVQLKGIRHQPPNLAPASTPHNAMVSSMFTMITTVMLARMPCPAATPTPSGPPVA